MANLRELAIAIGWRIDDRVLKRSDRLTDDYKDKVEDLSDEIQKIGGDFKRAATLSESALKDIGGAADDVRSAIKGIPDPSINGSTAQRNLNEIEITADEVRTAIRNIPDPEIDSSQARRELEKVEDKAFDVREAVLNIGGALAGGTALNAISEVDNSLYGLQARLGLTREEAEDLRSVAIDVFKNNFGESIDEAVNTVELLNLTTGEEGERLKSLAQDVLLIGEAYNQDLRELVKSTRAHAHSMGISFDDALNVVATGYKENLNIADDWLETLNEFSPAFERIGKNSGEMIAILREGLFEFGIRDTDRIADAVNEFGIRMLDGSDTTAEALEIIGLQADEIVKQFAQGGESAEQVTDQVLEGLFSIDDNLKRNQVGVALFGGLWEDTAGKVGEALYNARNETVELSDATEELGIKHESASSKIRGFGRKLWGEAIEPISELGSVAQTAIQGIGQLAVGVLALKGLGIDKLFSGFPKIGGVVGKSAGGLSSVAGTIGNIGKGIGRLAGRAFIPLSIGLGAYNILTAQEGDRGGAIGSVAGGLGGAAAGAAIGSVIPGVGTLIGGAIGGLAGSFGGEAIGRWIQGIDFSAIGEKTREARDEALEWLKRLPGDAAEQLGYMVGRAVGELQQLPGEFSAWFQQSRDNAIAWISGLPDEIGSFLASIPDRVTNSIGTLWSSFAEWGRSIPGAIMDGFNSAVEGIGEAGKWVLDQIGKGISGLKSLGGRVAEGFERGRVSAHAIGGIFDRPHLGLFAEDGAEAVIPLEKYRSRALSLWAETGRILGVRAYAEGGITGSIPTARTVASANFNPTVQINVYGGSSDQATAIKREIERIFPDLMEDFFDRLALKMG